MDTLISVAMLAFSASAVGLWVASVIRSVRRFRAGGAR